MNKKRKFQNEQSGLPKHKSFDGSATSEHKQSLCNENPIKIDIMDSGDESYDQDSAQGSNSFESVSKPEMVYKKLSTGTFSATCGNFPAKLGSGEMVYIDYEEHMLKLGEFELKNDGIEEFYSDSDDTSGNKFVLSSGRWDVNQGTKNLTIDKEFEQYFSMLLL